MNDLDFNSWVCPLPLRDYPKIVLGHGGGGKLSNELIENLFLPAFANETLEKLGDAATINLNEIVKNGSRLAYSTDSFVVNPLFFPGGKHRRSGDQRNGQRRSDVRRDASVFECGFYH